MSTLESTPSFSGSGASDVTGPFSFDGSTSDIAQQLYLRYQAGDEIDRLTLQTVPEAVRARLDNTSVTFEDLPGLMQRAVVWDTGFVISPDNRAVQVWTLGNRSMADITVSAQQFSSAGCAALSCTQTNDETAQIYASCSSGPAQLLKVSKCVVESFESDDNSNKTLWSAGGDPTVIPEIRVVKNSGVNDCGCEYEVYAIHTLSASDEPTSGQCPAGNGYASLVVPCFGSGSISDPIAAEMTTPQATDWVTRWLRQHGESVMTGSPSGSTSQASSSATAESEGDNGGGLSWWWLLIILLIILLLIIAAIAACVRHCHRLSRMNAANDDMTFVFVGGRMWAVADDSGGRGATYWLRFANWWRKTFSFFN